VKFYVGEIVQIRKDRTLPIKDVSQYDYAIIKRNGRSWLASSQQISYWLEFPNGKCYLVSTEWFKKIDGITRIKRRHNLIRAAHHED
jgi:hypothetical protein